MNDTDDHLVLIVGLELGFRLCAVVVNAKLILV